MKLEFIQDGSPDCPLIRLFDYKIEEVVQLRREILRLVSGELKSLNLRRLDFIEPVADCRLRLEIGTTNKGTEPVGDGNEFVCELTAEYFDGIIELLDPFADGSSGYQWLDETGSVSLLISRDGLW